MLAHACQTAVGLKRNNLDPRGVDFRDPDLNLELKVTRWVSLKHGGPPQWNWTCSVYRIIRKRLRVRRNERFRKNMLDSDSPETRLQFRFSGTFPQKVVACSHLNQCFLSECGWGHHQSNSCQEPEEKLAVVRVFDLMRCNLSISERWQGSKVRKATCYHNSSSLFDHQTKIGPLQLDITLNLCYI